MSPAHHVLMLRPYKFGYNNQTSRNNFFQNKATETSIEEAAKGALKEFDLFVLLLKKNGVKAEVFKEQKNRNTPDSIFPNNWVSFHSCGSLVLYPMYAENRRLERRADIINTLHKKNIFKAKNIFDLSSNESQNLFLEGTGSMVLDRQNKICYAALSERTEKTLVLNFCNKLSYEPLIFNAYQTVSGKRQLIYHTNVMMCIADKYAIVCLDSIDDLKQKSKILQKLKKTNKEIIEISEEQVAEFAGNTLQVSGNKKFHVMSTSAYRSMSTNQINQIEKYNSILHSPLNTIEKIGGGSARCMMAEIF